MFRKTSPLVSMMNQALVDLPTPINISVNWNWGSILGMILVNQLITGILLSMRFSAHISIAFSSVVSLVQDSDYGWLLRLMHSTGASFFFLFLYLHIGRGLYYGAFSKTVLWNLGVSIYLLLMGTAFLGYVLPWGQMSYWAATVITNLLSAIPLAGEMLVIWVWGGFAVANPTLTRFYSLHFMLPFIVSGLVIMHIYYLHMYGSSNPLGTPSHQVKLSFHYYFSVKDSLLFLILGLLLIFFSCSVGYSFMDAENFIPANALVTPIHIQPEWYFLFAYAILRAIPNKLGGVLGLLIAVLILLVFSIGGHQSFGCGMQNAIFSRFLYWSFISTFALLTWLGACPAEYPYIGISQSASLSYFVLSMLMLMNISNVKYSSN